MYQKVVKNIIYPLSDKFLGLSIDKNLKKIEIYNGFQTKNCFQYKIKNYMLCFLIAKNEYTLLQTYFK